MKQESQKTQKSYSKFTFEDLHDLGLQTIVKDLFDDSIAKVQPSEWLLATLSRNMELPLGTEKAKSELVISPVLVEVRERNKEVFAVYSGFNFEVDRKRGLQGFCDFLLAKMPMSVVPQTPIIAVVEAKHQQDLSDAVPQCAAEMYAARLWNDKRQAGIKDIYGAITSGENWLFVHLEDSTIWVDKQTYSIKNLPELLGVWQRIIDCF